jgi:hypothetical protein
MAELKTKVNKASVDTFLKSIKDPVKRADCITISKMMQKVSKAKPEMWGASIVGFGRRTYTYANGKTGEWMVIGFAPRASGIALYGLIVFSMAGGTLKEGDNDFLLKLGKHKKGGGCLYINKLADVDTKQLEKIIALAMKRKKQA